MRCFLQLFVVLLFCTGAFAQEIKPDIIFEVDQAKIKARVLEVTDSVVYYRNFKQLHGPIYSLSREKIIKIEYANGYVELYSAEQEQLHEEKKKKQKVSRSKQNSIAKANKEVGEQLSAQVQKEEKSSDKTKVALDTQEIKIIADSLQEPAPSNQKEVEKRITYKPRTVLSLAADASRMLTGAFEEKLAVDYAKGYGGMLRFQYNVSDELGLRLSSGYMQWSRKDSIDHSQTMTSTLIVVPVVLGAKYYFNKVIYMAGEAGFSAQKTSFKTFDNETENNKWQTLTSDFVIQPSAVVSLGAEVRITKVLFDVSPFFQWMSTEDSEFGSYFAGIRVGLGLAMGKRQ
ncbi:hypothetical protein GCM10023188_36380 [Pontibacter saemangeumensis]|uniref:Outer membrane protein beta-barrel domain-containing protein n=1 Tax=Pontibacter saemangeumensis TaxID=1084525 RepID=A0ABP8LZY8_9BACT